MWELHEIATMWELYVIASMWELDEIATMWECKLHEITTIGELHGIATRDSGGSFVWQHMLWFPHRILWWLNSCKARSSCKPWPIPPSCRCSSLRQSITSPTLCKMLPILYTFYSAVCNIPASNKVYVLTRFCGDFCFKFSIIHVSFFAVRKLSNSYLPCHNDVRLCCKCRPPSLPSEAFLSHIYTPAARLFLFCVVFRVPAPAVQPQAQQAPPAPSQPQAPAPAQPVPFFTSSFRFPPIDLGEPCNCVCLSESCSTRPTCRPRWNGAGSVLFISRSSPMCHLQMMQQMLAAMQQQPPGGASILYYTLRFQW